MTSDQASFRSIVQTKVRLKSSPDHVIRAHRELVCSLRWSDRSSIRSDHLDLGNTNNNNNNYNNNIIKIIIKIIIIIIIIKNNNNNNNKKKKK